MVIPSIAGDTLLKQLVRRLDSSRGVVHVSGLWGSSAPMIAAATAAHTSRVCLYVTPHAEQADDARDDLELFLDRPCELFPAWESLPGEGTASREIEAERNRVCGMLDRIRRGMETAPPPVITVPILALMQPVPTSETMARNTLHLSTAGEGATDHTPQGLLEWVIDRGFERLPMVESPGDVALRGDILDLFVPGEANPVRIQFLDTRVESIRRFDVSTQRSIAPLPSVTVTAMVQESWTDGSAVTDLIAHLPEDSLIILDGPGEIQEMGETLRRRLGNPDRVRSVTDTLSRCSDFPQLHLSRFAPAATADEDVFELAVHALSRFEGDAGEAVRELIELSRDHEVNVICDNEGERQRLSEMITEESPEATINLTVGVMHGGFEWSRTRTVIVPHHEIFRRARPRRRVRRVHAGSPLASWIDLNPRDLVVHVVHGIAVYRGLAKMTKGTSAQQEEFLTLEFADKAIVHVPCSQIDLVQKYIGSGGNRPRLSKIGGKRWTKTKEQVADAVSELAEMLLRIQAVRAAAKGIAYPADTEWQREFEASFLYEETEDQLTVAEEIRTDLMGLRPMDRLVCGDVGYGKTELAMRAAFKVVEFGRQVAVLVPTTVLAEQHYATFRERMADYPFAIGCLSRFRHARDMREIIEKVRKGQIDIVIGTHRLLSKDIRFANLGLVVIDEEQRFGVEHKERLKSMRETVDVLTLTATPIPRTLHMSMVGVRDISSLQTPPVDRRAIATQVRTFDIALIRDAILREMNRDGQIYFVHNFVQSIAAMADTIRNAVPEARVIYGHGQMKNEELENVMNLFVRREADVLVATTIIESGIDIPSVNTIFINRADRFGLADLHQLRGRVGRSDHRAYCYLLLSPDRPPTAKAAKRIKAIEEFSELGAGFRIAMRDLEIRGAGNLLGKEQSGHIAAVGYELYCQLLDQTVRRLKNEPDRSPPPVHVDLDVAAHVPRHYVAGDRARIEVYRRIVACLIPEDLTQLEKDLIDAFGPFPTQVSRLLEVAEIRVRARSFGVRSISLQPPDVVFLVDHLPSAEPLFTGAPGSVRMPDDKTIHLRLPPAYLETATLLPVLRKMFRDAGDPAEVAS